MGFWEPKMGFFYTNRIVFLLKLKNNHLQGLRLLGAVGWACKKRVASETPSLAASEFKFYTPSLAAGEFEFQTPQSRRRRVRIKKQ